MTDRLGGYCLGARLDGGGRVAVHEAYDEAGERYALAAPALGDVAAARRVRSLSVAAVVAACPEAEPPYLVSEYVPGPTLRQVVARHGPYAGDDLYRLAAATVTALAAVHEAGTVHGGLTPDRIVLGAEGPRLTGLGLTPPLPAPADPQDRVHDGRAPRAGPLSTRGATPEDEGGAAGDVSAWGRLMLFAAYGPDRPSDGGERLDRPLRALVAAALHRDPDRRPPARQLLLSLLDVPQSQQGRLLPPEPVDDPPLGDRAEAVYRRLDPAEQDLVPEVFLRLAGPEPGTVASAARGDLVAGRGEEEAAAIGRVLAAFAAAGLLTEQPGTAGGTAGDAVGGTVGIGCAALPRAWPRLREWLDGERDGLAVHRELAGAARRWEAGGRREAELLRGEPLERALAWAAGGRRRVTLSAGEQSFLDAALTRSRRRTRRARRRWTAVAALLPLVLALGLGQALAQRGAAEARLELAMAKVAASRAEQVRPADPVTARRLSLAAWRLAPAVPEVRRAMAAVDPAVAAFADPAAGPRTLHAVSGDGALLAALEEDTLRVYDVATGRELARTAGPEQSVRALAWSPDGRTLALVGVDRSYLWTPGSPAVGPPFGRGLGAPGEQAAWFSPGGGLLFAAARQSGERWAWDLRARRAAFVGEYAVVGPADRVALVFAGRRSQLRRDGRATPAAWLDRMPWEYTAFAPDGRRVAIAEESGIQVYGLDGVPADAPRLRPSPAYLRFSPDGRLLAATDDERVRVWRLGSIPWLVAERAVPASGADRPARAVFTPDGRLLRVLAGRGVVLTLDLEPAPPPRDPAAHVCARYGPLSPQEWARHLPELPYRPTC
ncbi:hypothetical protein MF672_002105 [Actinomadura sp. ATCC 31491]|uniref:Protein kinase domain-containing protein n=1 Tax=Actinomadura luzonensis TaxID=2805427 RepID=A0ABT0FK71_9ACTN|nr:hypothetical protein [Actinomadura luzonensis]MCK2212598.1 hypothetical protein [Actinomadura luzonensis]